jgi:hypothetical protein
MSGINRFGLINSPAYCRTFFRKESNKLLWRTKLYRCPVNINIVRRYTRINFNIVCRYTRRVLNPCHECGEIRQCL